jgi:hypothetical protein
MHSRTCSAAGELRREPVVNRSARSRPIVELDTPNWTAALDIS